MSEAGTDESHDGHGDPRGARQGRATPTAGALLVRMVRGPGGVVRVVGLVSVVVALVVGNAVDAALFLLVLGGLTVPALGGVARPLDAAYGVGLLVAAACGALGLYETVAWLDVVMHLVVTALVAAVAHVVLARWTGALADPMRPPPSLATVGSVAVTVSLGLALSVLWEVGEYLGHTYADPSIYVTYPDTIGDLVMGGVGSAVAGRLLIRAGRRASRGADHGR